MYMYSLYSQDIALNCVNVICTGAPLMVSGVCGYHGNHVILPVTEWPKDDFATAMVHGTVGSHVEVKDTPCSFVIKDLAKVKYI